MKARAGSAGIALAVVAVAVVAGILANVQPQHPLAPVAHEAALGSVAVSASGCEAPYALGPDPVSVRIYRAPRSTTPPQPVATGVSHLGGLKETFRLPPGLYVLETSAGLGGRVRVTSDARVSIGLHQNCASVKWPGI